MTIAKRILMVVLFVAATSQLFGCGVGTTPAENRRAAARVIDYDSRMMVDDLALFTQLNRPHRSSRWIID